MVDAVFVVAMLMLDDVVAVAELPDNVPENVVAVIVPVEGLTVTVDTVEVAAPDNEPEAGVNIIGWFDDVDAATTFTFCPVVAKPVTLPVKLPVNAPENVVAATVPVDGFTVTVDTVELAAPDNVPEAGVKTTG